MRSPPDSFSIILYEHLNFVAKFWWQFDGRSVTGWIDQTHCRWLKIGRRKLFLSGESFERCCHRHRIDFGHRRHGRVHLARCSRTDAQFRRSDTSFLDKKLAGLQPDLFDYHGHTDRITAHIGLCCPGAGG
jgi:hypothetical protein